MFRRSSEPLALSEASLLVLRPALNAPVLNTDFLPVGPARAAIVVFAEEYGGIGLAIGIRSSENGQIVVFQNQEPIDASVKLAEALEPALVSGERMGFLFDEDMVESASGGEGRAQAMALWGSLMGEPEMPASPVTSEPIIDLLAESTTNIPGLDAAVPELLLNDVAPSELPVELEADSEPLAAPALPNPPGQQLSKFRNASPVSNRDPARPKAEADRASPSVEGGGSELGRIPLVRVRGEGAKRVPILARLLASF